ncbi:hypothetical protein NLU13_6951 [Sarocladium strictum]|uniref:Uncharacterized protein n=1 Tax=Sarocladium strictum TaxID=5046 RepID=A0AA39L6M0_SARSR|nr:hypothetical protein NLU13_6951 [Sarocladium strictum]
MAEQKTQEALNTLQSMLNNVLVETGKALRAARKDGRGLNVPPREPSGRMSESIRTFHQALDTLESDIISAKSVLQRDLKQIREKSEQVTTPQVEPAQNMAPVAQMSQTPVPQPVDAQTKSPMVIDLESSPPANGSPTLIKSEPTAPAPVANMNGDTNGMTNGNMTHVPIPLPPTNSAPSMTQQLPAPAAVMEQDGAGGVTGLGTQAANTNHITTMDGGNNELNFTNMTFAPPNEEAPMSTNSQEQNFNMSNFAPADGNNGGMSVDHDDSFMQDNNAQNTANNSNAGGQAQDTTATGDKGGSSLDDFDWSLGNEGGGDGLDFDFSIGGEDTFNTLMNERDGEFSMDQGGFDTDPFNMGKPDGS